MEIYFIFIFQIYHDNSSVCFLQGLFLMLLQFVSIETLNASVNFLKINIFSFLADRSFVISPVPEATDEVLEYANSGNRKIPLRVVQHRFCKLVKYDAFEGLRGENAEGVIAHKQIYDANQPGPSRALTPAERWERCRARGNDFDEKFSAYKSDFKKVRRRVLNQTPSFLAIEVSGTTLLMNVSYLLMLLYVKLSLAYTLFLFFYFK